MAHTAPRLLRRAVGGILILLIAVPFWKLLSAQRSPIALEAIRQTDTYVLLLLQGTLGVLVLAALAAFVLSPASIEQPLLSLAKWLQSVGTTRFAVVLALVSMVLTALFVSYVWDSKPVLVDALAQFVQARYLAEGMLSGPPAQPYEFWVSANTLVTEHGWVSIYPPGHMVILAIGFAAGAVWIAWPAMMAVAVFFTTLVAERLLPEDKIVARTGAVLFALSPFLIWLSAAHMSHATGHGPRGRGCSVGGNLDDGSPRA